MTLKYIKALFFDFDGVLADSVEVKTRAFAKLFECYGIEIKAKVVEHHLSHGGMARVDKFCHYYKNFLCEPLSDKILDDLCQKFSQLVVNEVIKSPEIPGAEAFLQRWHNRVPSFVISATPEEEINEIVQRRGLQKYFMEVLGTPTTKSQNLKNMLIKYNIKSSNCLFFGDSESDYLAAQTCKVNFFAILPGPEAPLLKAVPDVKWDTNFNNVKFYIENIL